LDSHLSTFSRSTTSVDGYDGTYEPQCVYLHWTASAPSSDTAAATVAANDYQCCVARSGLVCLGGWEVRQAHGGKGRTAPIQLARDGQMTVDAIRDWQSSGAPDDTDSWPNRYGVAVSIDNSGVGEIPPDAQYENWCKTAAVMLDAIDATGPGHLIDHASSTNRKIDITPIVDLLDPARWYATIGDYLTQLRGGPPDQEVDPMPMYQYLVDEEAGHLLLADGMQVRWLRTEWDNANTRAWLIRLGLPAEPLKVSRQSLRLGEFGVWIGDLPPW